jgi:hypothetical protein
LYDSPGDEIAYELAVINTGNQTLSDVVVTDPLLAGPVCTFASLGPGLQESCGFTHRVSAADLDAGQVTNRASASGKSPNQQPVTATSNEVVVPGIHRPELTIVKSTSTTTFDAAGAEIPFRFTVINTGNTTLEDIAVTDAKVAGVACPTTVITPGGSMTCTATYTATRADSQAGRVTNVATATGHVPGRPPLPPVSSNQVEIRVAAPPTTTAAPPGTVAPARTPAAEVTVPSATTSSPDSQLPGTGRNATALVLAAVGLATLGGSMRWSARCLRRTTVTRAVTEKRETLLRPSRC